MLHSGGLGLDSIAVWVAPLAPPRRAGVASAPAGAASLQWNAQQPMQPASVMKLLTSAVALDHLGPVYRGTAVLRSASPPVDDRLRSPLILQGQGSPDLDIAAFTALLRTLREGTLATPGIAHIDADFSLDWRHFTPQRADIGTPPFDEQPEFRYNVIPDAIALNMNLTRITLRASADAGPIGVQATLALPLDGLVLKNELTVGELPCADWEDGWILPTVGTQGGVGVAGSTTTITLKGTFPRNCWASTEINVLERTDYADRLFRTLWRGLGGSYSGTTRAATAGDLALLAANDAVFHAVNTAAGAPSPDRALREPPRAQPVRIGHQSRPLAEFIRDINKRSDNPTTRLLYLALAQPATVAPAAAAAAALAGGVAVPAAEPTDGTAAKPATLSAAVSTSNLIVNNATDTGQTAKNTLKTWLERQNIDADGLVIDNGSGLSRSERISAAQLAGVLQAAAHGPWAAEFMASLPIVGLDGSMRRRLSTGPAAQRGRIKTGSLRNVGAVAGYITDSSNTQHVVVAIINHEGAKRSVAQPILDALLAWVAAGQPRE